MNKQDKEKLLNLLSAIEAEAESDVLTSLSSLVQEAKDILTKEEEKTGPSKIIQITRSSRYTMCALDDDGDVWYSYNMTRWKRWDEGWK
jgi:predicted lactoylglutathione lyase